VVRARDLSAAGFRIERAFERVRVSCPDSGARMEYLDWRGPHPARHGAWCTCGGARARPMTVNAVARAERWHHATHEYASQAESVFDTVHILRHLNDALDDVRRAEDARAQGRPRRCLKGHRETLLSHRENLNLNGRRALTTRLAATRRLHTASLLQESFGQRGDYRSDAWARTFFENGNAALQWQRLKPFEKFAAMIERHGDGIVSSGHPANTVALGCVEGLHNTGVSTRPPQWSASSYFQCLICIIPLWPSRRQADGESIRHAQAPHAHFLFNEGLC